MEISLTIKMYPCNSQKILRIFYRLFFQQKRSLSNDCNSAETSVVEPKSLEIWAHESCFVWAPGVHLIGSKIIGLEEAVWEAVQTVRLHFFY